MFTIIKVVRTITSNTTRDTIMIFINILNQFLFLYFLLSFFFAKVLVILLPIFVVFSSFCFIEFFILFYKAFLSFKFYFSFGTFGKVF